MNLKDLELRLFGEVTSSSKKDHKLPVICYRESSYDGTWGESVWWKE